MQRMSGCSQNNESSSRGSNPAAGELKGMGGAGSNFIAGVLIQAKKKKLSVYEAMMRGLLTPGTALVLLEAQAASGLLTDPVRNQQLSVKEALAQGLIGRDFYEKLLSAEGAVTGYTEPYTGRRISLFQAMKQEFIVRDHAVRLLQAQIATGGIIDPARGHRVPVEVAHERGYLDQELSRFLSDPENQTRSCFDPNTHENLTYLQLLRRCVPDPDTGLLMLQLMDKGSVLYQLSEDARKALQAARTTLAVGLFQGQSVTVWELLFSRYVPEHRREELLRRYKAGTVTIPQMVNVLTAAVAGAEREDGALGPATAKPDEKGRASPPAQDTQAQEKQLRKSLKSATVRVTAGEFRGQNVSVLDLLFSKYVPQGKRQELLELYRAGILTTEQVATVVTTMVNRTEAANAALVANARSPRRAAAVEDGEDGPARLDGALKSTTISVPAGELQGKQVSLWDLLFSHYTPEEKRQELLELYHERLLTLEQMTTVVTTLIKKKESAGRKLHITVKSSNKDPVTAAGEEGDGHPRDEPWETTLKTTVVDVGAGEFRGHRVSLWDLLHSRYIPQENRKELLELYQAGELTLEQVKTVVTTIVTRAAAGERAEPGTPEGGPRAEPAAPEDGPRAEPEAPEGGPRAEPEAPEDEPTPLHGDRAWEETLKATTAEVSVGEFQGRHTSLWDLLFSHYIPEEKRQELLELYRAGTLPMEQMTTVVTALIKKKESAGRELHITVKSSNKDPVTAAGEEGDGHPREEPWETTLKTTVVHVGAGEFRGHRVSLWDLLHSRYIPQENRKELLELYQAGELTLEQVKTVVTTIVTRAAAGERAEPGTPEGGPRAEPGTPEDGPRAEPAAPEGGPRAEPAAPEDEPTPLHGDRAWEETLKTTTAEVSVGEFQGRLTSLWDLLFSHYIPEEKRQELLELYRAGTLPLEQMTTVVTALFKKKESAGRELHITVKSSNKDPVTAAGEEGDGHPREEPWETTLKTTVVDVGAGEFRGHRVSLWDLLHSRYIPQENRKELLELYQAGELTLEQVKTVVTTIVTRAAAGERAEPEAPEDDPRAEPAAPEDGPRAEPAAPEGGPRAEPGTPEGGPRAQPAAPEDEPTPLHRDRAWEETLKSTTAEVSVGEFQGRPTSLWDLLFSHYIPEEKRQELLELYRAGTLPLEQMTTVVTALIKKKESAGRELHITVKSSNKDPVTAAGEEGDGHPREEPWETTLKTTVVDVGAGEFRGHRVSLWDLLHSRYIPQENRKELLELYQAGELTLEQVKTVVTTIVTRAAAGERAEPEAPEGGPRAEPAAPEGGPRAEPAAPEDEPTPLHRDRAWEETLKATTAEVSVGEFQGRLTSLWDLLFSHYIPEEKRQELLELYRGGTLPIQELLSTTSSLASDSLEQRFRALPAHTMDLLRSEGSYITFDPSQERRVSVWELLSSRQVSEYKREACLDSYPSGGLTVNRITITTTISTGPRPAQSHPRHH